MFLELYIAVRVRVKKNKELSNLIFFFNRTLAYGEGALCHTAIALPQKDKCFRFVKNTSYKPDGPLCYGIVLKYLAKLPDSNTTLQFFLRTGFI